MEALISGIDIVVREAEARQNIIDTQEPGCIEATTECFRLRVYKGEVFPTVSSARASAWV